MAKQIVDKSSIIIPDGTMEDFKRSNHDDFATTSELREREFSGIRHNSVSDNCEIWILGKVEVTITQAQIRLNPRAIDKAYAELFALDEVAPDLPKLRQYKQMVDLQRKRNQEN